MFNVLWFIGKILFAALAVFSLTKLLGRKNSLPKGRIIEGEVIESGEDKI